MRRALSAGLAAGRGRDMGTVAQESIPALAQNSPRAATELIRTGSRL